MQMVTPRRFSSRKTQRSSYKGAVSTARGRATKFIENKLAPTVVGAAAASASSAALSPPLFSPYCSQSQGHELFYLLDELYRRTSGELCDVAVFWENVMKTSASVT